MKKLLSNISPTTLSVILCTLGIATAVGFLIADTVRRGREAQQVYAISGATVGPQGIMVSPEILARDIIRSNGELCFIPNDADERACLKLQQYLIRKVEIK